MEIESIRHKALRRFFESGNPKGLVGEAARIGKTLAFIVAAGSLEELATPPNYGLRPLTGDRAGSWAMTVTRNWRMMFRIGDGAALADLIWRIIMALEMHPSLAVHAGDWLRTEIVEPSGLSVTDLARHLGVTRQAVSTLLNGRAGLSADMALRFEQAFGVRADTMLRMQAAYELAQVRRRADIRVERLSLAA